MQNTIEIQKILSTSLTYCKNNTPQWVSDTQLNYMSQHDFITYDLDEDRLDLIPRPLKQRVLCVKYMPLIGHYNVRIVYVYRDEEKDCFYFVMLPSLSYNEGYCLKKVSIMDRKVKWIQDFIYFSQGHYVIFTALFENDEVGVVCMNLLNSHYNLYILKQQKETNTTQDHRFEFINQLPEEESDNFIKIKGASLISTKSPSDCVLFYNSSLYLLRLSKYNSQFSLLHKIQIQQKLPFYSPLQCNTIILSKTYIVIKNNTQIMLYYIDDDKIHEGYHHDIHRNSNKSQIGSLTCSLHSNKIIVSIKNTSILLQYRINDISDIIEYVNCIDFENQLSHISKIIVSDTGRNVVIFSFADKHKDNQKGCLKIYGEEVTNVRIFKIQLYTELGIPDYTLCLKQTKYKARNKRVNRIAIPKIYEKVYALTGAEVHTLQNHKISGVMFFDIHPFGFYIAVSYHFNIKIFSIESHSMTLLYSMSLQNLKKIMFSPDGSSLVIFSPKHLKILDSFSFQPKYEIFEKSGSSIIDISFAEKKCSLLILYENGVLAERSFYDFQKIKIYRIYGHGHRRITCFKMDEKNQNIYFVLEDGSLIIKHANNLTASEILLWYEDEQKITQLYIDIKNRLIFVGTKAGILRIHNISRQKFSIKQYHEIAVSEYEITAIVCSNLENSVYVGNAAGDITVLKYNSCMGENFLSKSTKILQTIAPKVAPYFSFDFQLISHTKFQGNAQQNILQDKLQNLIEKIQNHTTNYKKTLIDSFINTEKEYFSKEEESSKNLYRDYDNKCKKVKIQIYSLKELLLKERKDAIEDYENRIKKVFAEQEQIQKRKTALINTQEQEKNQIIKMMNEQKKRVQQQYEEGIEKFEVFYKKQKYSASLDDMDNDFKIPDAEVLKTLNVKLSEELINLRARCQQLKKSNSYLQTAKFNIQSRKVQQQTLEHRINQELKLLKQVGNKQKQKISSICVDLRLTQQQIHRIQNKVKNTPNNVISTDKADSDLCSYKIWMKDKVSDEIAQLSQYLTGLEDNFQAKSQEIVEISNRIRLNEEKIQNNKVKQNQLREKLRTCQYRLVMMQNSNAAIEKNIHPTLLTQLKLQANETGYSFQANKAQKIAYIQKLNQKALYFENKNLKIHVRKIKNLNANNAQLLHEYEKLKYENKWLLDKQIQNEQSLKRLKQAALQKQKRKSQERGIHSERASIYKQNETPFATYVRNRASKTKRSLNCLAETRTTSISRMKNTMRSATSSRIY